MHINGGDFVKGTRRMQLYKVLTNSLCIAIVLTGVGISKVAYSAKLGPSFSCDGKLNAIEAAICDSSELSKLDRELSVLYKYARLISPNPDQIKRDQRNWLVARNKCSSAQSLGSCIGDQYRKRSEVLFQVGAPDPSEYLVEDIASADHCADNETCDPPELSYYKEWAGSLLDSAILGEEMLPDAVLTKYRIQLVEDRLALEATKKSIERDERSPAFKHRHLIRRYQTLTAYLLKLREEQIWRSYIPTDDGIPASYGFGEKEYEERSVWLQSAKENRFVDYSFPREELAYMAAEAQCEENESLQSLAERVNEALNREIMSPSGGGGPSTDGWSSTEDPVKALLSAPAGEMAYNTLLAAEAVCKAWFIPAKLREKAISDLLALYLEQSERYDSVDFRWCDYAYNSIESNFCLKYVAEWEKAEDLAFSVEKLGLDVSTTNPARIFLEGMKLDPRCFQGWRQGYPEGLEPPRRANLAKGLVRRVDGKVSTPYDLLECSNFASDFGTQQLRRTDEQDLNAFVAFEVRGVIDRRYCSHFFEGIKESCLAIFEIEFEEWGGGSLNAPPSKETFAILRIDDWLVLARAEEEEWRRK